LDWFWRGWFYGIDPCDIAIDTVKHGVYDPNMAAQAGFQGGRGGAPMNASSNGMMSLAKPMLNPFDDISKIRNRNDKSIIFLTDADTTLRDFYWRYARGIEPYDTTKYKVTLPTATPEPMDDAAKAKYANVNLYEITFSNKGGLVMPIIVEFSFEDGTKQTERIPAQVWRLNENKVTKLFLTNKKAVGIKLDPMRETADINENNNTWGMETVTPSKFAIFKARQGGGRGQSTGINPMQKAMEKKN
jgi:hypothetical protein